MNKDYVIKFKEGGTRVRVYLVPHNVGIIKNSLFNIMIGFIDLDEDPFVFHCIDSDRMTIGVMESIVYQWGEWEASREKSPI